MIAKLLKTVSLVALILAFATLVPCETASKASLFGYKSLCTFTPGSTFILFMAYLVTSGMARKLTVAPA